MNNWIDFRKQKPQDMQAVLCYDEERKIHIVCQYNNIELSLRDIYGENHFYSITHWTELTVPENDGWIPVKEQLPLDTQRVLACDINDDEEDVYIDCFWMEEKEPVWAIRKDNPTHWMPLPSKKRI